MTVESVTYIDDLNATYPAAGDAKSEGDDHIRNIKTAIKATFPNVDGAVSATDEDLSRVAGANTAVFTFDSGNLGIGGTPTQTLDVFGTGRFRQADVNREVLIAADGGGMAIYANADVAGERLLIIGTNDTERLRIDASGNFIPILQTSAPSLATNSQMVFTLTSNTNLRISVRGSDGTTRTTNLTLS